MRDITNNSSEKAVDPIKRLPARYRLYVDESGDHTYSLLDDPGHRYLALLGVWFRQADDYITSVGSTTRMPSAMSWPKPAAAKKTCN